MAATIKGINVVIGAETTGLQKALSDVNRKSRDIASELRKVERGLKFNPKDTTLLAQKQKLLGEQVAVTKEKLDRLKAAQEQVNEQFRKGEISEEQYRAFQRELVETESKLKHFEKRLRETGMTAEQLGKKLRESGKKMTEAGKNLSMKLTAPILGVGAAAVKIGMDFEQSMSKVQAMSGASAGEIKDLEKAARDAGASTSKSAKDAADALGYMALAGWDTKTSMEGLMPVLRLSEAGNIDLARASSLVTDSMSAMGITTKELPKYLDIVAQTARSSNTDIDQMAEAYLGVGGTLRGLKADLGESALALGFLANAGVKGSEAGKGLNAILTNLTAPTGRAKEALDELGFTAFDSAGNFKGLENVLFELKDKTAGMTDEQRNMYLSMIGGKEHIKSLNALLNGLDDSYDELKGSIADADGALEDVAKTMQKNNKGSLVELQSALEELALKIYDVLRPSVAKIIEYLQKFTDKLNNLSPGMQKTIVIVAGLVAAIGPLLVIAGALISSIGTIATFCGVVAGAMAAAGGAAGILGSALAVLTGPVGLIVAGVAGLTFGVVKLVKHLKSDAAPAVELFGEECSDATKKAVKGYLELDDKATKSLMHLQFTSSEVSKETAGELTATFGKMGKQIKDGMQKDFDETHKIMQDHFKSSSALTEEEEAEALTKLKENHEHRVAVVDEGENRIKEIIQAAANEKRELRDDELLTIKNIQEQMKETAVVTLSETELESKAIIERMKTNAETLTAEQAASVVRESHKQKEEAVKAAEDQYKETVKNIIRQRDELGVISEEQAQKLIAEAESQKDQVVAEAENMHFQVEEQAREQAEEHAKWVDWETGEIKSKWQVMCEDVSEGFSGFGESASELWDKITSTIKEVNENAGENTASSWGHHKGNILKGWDQLKTGAGQKFGDIRNAIRNRSEDAMRAGNRSFGGLATSAIDKFESMRKKASEVTRKIKDFFARLKLPEIKPPKLKMPHLRVTGDWSFRPPRVPSFSVRWYDKGGIFRNPAIIGVGEKRPEIVGALDDVRYIFRDELRSLQLAGASQSAEVHLHIGTLVADDMGLKKLEQMLRKFRKSEDQRRGGR